MAAPTQLACEFCLFRLFAVILLLIRVMLLTCCLAVRTLKGIGVLDAAPVYEPLPGFTR